MHFQESGRCLIWWLEIDIVDSGLREKPLHIPSLSLRAIPKPWICFDDHVTHGLGHIRDTFACKRRIFQVFDCSYLERQLLFLENVILVLVIFDHLANPTSTHLTLSNRPLTRLSQLRNGLRIITQFLFHTDEDDGCFHDLVEMIDFGSPLQLATSLAVRVWLFQLCRRIIRGYRSRSIGRLCCSRSSPMVCVCCRTRDPPHCEFVI
jgi:hypothetical protein